MSKPFDMELFLASVLTGSHATRQRHLRQAKIIQAEMADRWSLETPWLWKRKHVIWFINHRLNRRSEATKYYYQLTIKLIITRLKRAWTLGTRKPIDHVNYKNPFNITKNKAP
ncbi:MAG: hypothetical protein LBJ33_08670 [Pseudomonas putida]|jgi:hypothetical protein|nr:hypothetical protein [Pseudomonas putida]